MQDNYNYIDSHFDYNFYTDGYIADIPNQWDIEIPIGYLNERFNNINGFSLDHGTNLNFSYNLEDRTLIPALVGKGLTEDYPVGAVFTITDPILNKDIPIQVVGVLKENFTRYNYYAFDLRQYHNFSIILPANKNFIDNASISFKINALMDLILTHTNDVEVSKLSNILNQSLNTKINIIGFQENTDYYTR